MYDIVKSLERIEDELIDSMIRNMDRHRAEETKEGYNWSQWQVDQLKALDEYKRRNRKKYKIQFKNINGKIENLIKLARAEGGMSQEENILKHIKEGFEPKRISKGISGEFFKTNDRKMNALIKATTNDMQKAEYAMLRRSEDKYRQIIFNAQMYANSGAATYEKAVDMATKDFLAAGINSIEYKNGARHTVPEYADMAIRTASKRAYLTGEGEKRKEWGISTVIMNKRGNPCPKCLPFVGKVLIDDVWSGGKQKDGPYELMSSAIAAGLYHPRCKDSHVTFFPELDESAKEVPTKAEKKEVIEKYNQQAKEQYAKRQEKKFDRLAKYSLDEDNRRVYEVRKKNWTNIIENSKNSDIMDIGNDAKALDSILIDVSDELSKYTREQLLEEMQKSPIGISTINQIANSNITIEFINSKQNHTYRGEQRGDKINIYLSNINSKRVAVQTIIHEMTHYFYRIGNCQHAEAICFSMEKMYIENRDYLTLEEWNTMVKLAVENYPELEWEDGGYGDFTQFNFVRG